MIFKNEYGDYKIVFDSRTGIYQAEDSDGAIIRDNFKDPEKLTESLDNLDKRKAEGPKKKATRIKVLFSDYRDHNFEEAEATSYAGASSWRNAHEAWIVVNGHRNKVLLEKICLDTPENRSVFTKMKLMNEEIKRLEDESNKLYASMPKLTPEMFETD